MIPCTDLGVGCLPSRQPYVYLQGLPFTRCQDVS